MSGMSFGDGMEALAAKARAVGDLIPAGAPVWLVDYPIYANFGDLLILLGTLEMLEGRGARIVDATSSGAGRATTRRKAPGLICVLQGGGNFGDLWPEHQALRETVIAKNPDRRIVGMPQSIHFDDARGLDRFAAIAAGHPDLHLFWRDKRSFALASERFSCRNYLAPDIAQALWPIYRQPPPAQDAGPLFLFRDDKETVETPPDIRAMRERFDDWWDFHSGTWKTALRLCHGMDRRFARLALPILHLWIAASRAEARRLAAIFGRHGEIVTSRLHGHIFACLTARRSRLVDNVYGKSSGYFDAWTADLGIATLASRTVAQYQPGR